MLKLSSYVPSDIILDRLVPYMVRYMYMHSFVNLLPIIVIFFWIGGFFVTWKNFQKNNILALISARRFLACKDRGDSVHSHMSCQRGVCASKVGSYIMSNASIKLFYMMALFAVSSV